jgi:hypothetical protein
VKATAEVGSRLPRGAGDAMAADASAAPGGSAAPEAARASRWLVPVFVLVIGNFMAVLDVTIVDVSTSWPSRVSRWARPCVVWRAISEC